MTLLILYGPPASGKYTIGKLISEQVDNWKLIHNHLLQDPLKAIMSIKAPGFWDARNKIAKIVFETAFDNNINVITTLGLIKPKYIEFISQIAKEKNQQILYVYVDCSEEERLKRVSSTTRKKMDKVNTPEELLKILPEYQKEPLENYHTMTLDTNNITAQEAAEQIINLINEQKVK